MGNICIFDFSNNYNTNQVYSYTDENYFKNTKIISTIGSGKFGEVFEVFNNKTNTHLALKKVKIDDYQTLSELNYMKSLKDKNIINCYEIIYDTKHVYFLMDLYKYDLLTYYENNVLKFKSEIFIKKIIRNLLEPLIFLYKRRLVHLDIKLENYLVKDNLELVLSDLSTLRPIDKCNYSNSKLYYLDRTCGTVQYASPEIFVSRYSEKSDIFSVGLIVFMFFTGRFLPDCKNKKFKYSKDILFSYDLSDDIKNFIWKCREIHIKNRFSYNEIKKNKWLY